MQVDQVDHWSWLQDERLIDSTAPGVEGCWEERPGFVVFACRDPEVCLGATTEEHQDLMSAEIWPVWCPS